MQRFYRIIFFWNKVFYADNYFMENSLTLRTHVSASQFHIAIIQWPYDRNVGDNTLLIQCKIFWRYWFHFSIHSEPYIMIVRWKYYQIIPTFTKTLITWLSEICLTSLIALLWNFPLMFVISPLLFSHSKNIRMSTLECFEKTFLLF